MLYKMCMDCGKVISHSRIRCDSCEKKKNKMQYEHNNKTHRRLYNTMRWRRLRTQVMDYYHNICVYSLYKYNEIRPAKILHHINLANEKNFFLIDNLIALDFSVHEKLHEDYTNEIKDELREYQRKWKEDFIPPTLW